MMQRVIAILTQASEVANAIEEDAERIDVSEQEELAGELVLEILRFDSFTARDPSPEAVAEAVMDAVRPRVGQMVGCFVAAFSRLAFHHDGGDADISSAAMLRRMALEWELDDEAE
jgi:hypothetical protein